MKKLLVIAFGLLVAGALTVSAAEGKQKKEMTPEQTKLRKEMMEKYDANKDKTIDEQEAAKISDEDKAKMNEAKVRITSGGKKKK